MQIVNGAGIKVYVERWARMIYIGIDPGKNGGIAILSDDSIKIKPYSDEDLINEIRAYNKSKKTFICNISHATNPPFAKIGGAYRPAVYGALSVVYCSILAANCQPAHKALDKSGALVYNINRKSKPNLIALSFSQD